LCEPWVYPVGTEGRLGGGETFGAEYVGDGCALVFGAVSTYGWYGFWGGCCGALWFMLWTSGSFGSSAGGEASSGGVSLTGLVRFGSSPALIAFSMRRAWYFAYLVLDATSGSSFFQMERMSRKADAARSVSTVLLAHSQYGCAPLLQRYALGGLVLCHFLVALGQRLQGELLAVCACSDVVENGVFVGVLGLRLLQLLHQVGRVGVAFLVRRVEACSDDFLHHVEAHCHCQYSCFEMGVSFSVLTPVRDNRLELLELRRPLRKRRELQALELRGHRVAHGCNRAAVMSAG
jgi:hypothetical protein